MRWNGRVVYKLCALSYKIIYNVCLNPYSAEFLKIY